MAPMSRPHIAAGFATAVLLTLTACSGGGAASGETATPVASSNAASEPAVSADTGSGKTSPAESAMAGSFIDYSDYQADQERFADNDVVLFFNASWCPTCQEATKNLKAAQVPEGLTVVSVDYDSNVDLRRDYGVTTQHTFVQVDPAGEELAKFTGATTVQEISEQLS
jgi:thiol-disulfide isomerase/thioredoxin